MAKSRSININHNYNRRRYGLGNFILDAILTVITGGLWLIWIFVREVRR